MQIIEIPAQMETINYKHSREPEILMNRSNSNIIASYLIEGTMKNHCNRIQTWFSHHYSGLIEQQELQIPMQTIEPRQTESLIFE